MSSAGGTPLREQSVAWDVTGDEVLAVNRSQRTRFVALVGTLSADELAAPSRCADWSVHEVVAHLVQVNRVFLDALAAAAEDRRFDGFRGFDPRSTPGQWLREDPPGAAGELAGRFARSTEQVLAATARLAADAPDDALPLVSTPAGRQPWPRALSHALFDSAVHERDVALALQRPLESDPAESRVVAAYQLLLCGRLLSAVGREAEVALVLAGDGLPAQALRLQVHGPQVSVDRAAAPDGAPRVVAAELADAMSGRGELPDGLATHATVLSVLQGLL